MQGISSDLSIVDQLMIITELVQEIESGGIQSEYLLNALINERDRSSSEIDRLLATFDCPQLVRLLRRGHNKTRVQANGDILSSIGGHTKTLFKASLPHEAQARVATDSFIARFLTWLRTSREYRATALYESDHHVQLFIPDGSGFVLEPAWDEFVRYAFSGRELLRNFRLMLNSIKLSARGFGVPNFPIVSDDQRFFIAGWCYQSIYYVARRQQRRASKIRQAQAEIQSGELNERERQSKEKQLAKVQQKQQEEREKYRSSFGKALRKLLDGQLAVTEKVTSLENQLTTETAPKKQATIKKKLEKERAKLHFRPEQIIAKQRLLNASNNDPFEFIRLDEQERPSFFDRVRAEARKFNESACNQIATFKGSPFANSVLLMYQLLESEPWQITIPSLLVEAPSAKSGRDAGDDNDKICYVCGRALRQGDTEQVQRLIFQKPEQRPQSRTRAKRPKACQICAALAFACPIKLSEESVVVRFEERGDESNNAERVRPTHQSLQEYTRMLTLYEMNTLAGPYLMLSCTEVAKDGKRASSVLGEVQYAAAKLAVTLPAEAFEKFDVHILAGISSIHLSRRHLAYLSVLARALQLRITSSGEINQPFGGAVRYVMQDEPILADYQVFNAKKKFLNSGQLARLERARRRYYLNLISEKEEHMENRAEFYRDVAAMTGLLYAFVSSARQKLKKTGDKDDDIDRELKKLIEECNDPKDYLYSFAKNSTYEGARLYRRDAINFIFEQAENLLRDEFQCDLQARRKKEDEGEFIVIYGDDLERAYAHFAERYPSDGEWNEFTYKLRLSLFSRFPDLLG